MYAAPLVSLSRVSFSYPLPGGGSRPALHDVSLDVRPGRDRSSSSARTAPARAPSPRSSRACAATPTAGDVARGSRGGGRRAPGAPRRPRHPEPRGLLLLAPRARGDGRRPREPRARPRRDRPRGRRDARRDRAGRPRRRAPGAALRRAEAAAGHRLGAHRRAAAARARRAAHAAGRAGAGRGREAPRALARGRERRRSSSRARSRRPPAASACWSCTAARSSGRGRPATCRWTRPRSEPGASSPPEHGAVRHAAAPRRGTRWHDGRSGDGVPGRPSITIEDLHFAYDPGTPASAPSCAASTSRRAPASARHRRRHRLRQDHADPAPQRPAPAAARRVRVGERVLEPGAKLARLLHREVGLVFQFPEKQLFAETVTRTSPPGSSSPGSPRRRSRPACAPPSSASGSTPTSTARARPSR